MLVCCCARVDWPYIENRFNFIVECHLVYAGVLVCLMAKHAGRVWGLDGWLKNLPFVKHRPLLPSVVG